MVTKQTLEQYYDLPREIEEVQTKINQLERYIDKINEDGNVIDTVSGGEGGIQHFKIEGFPEKEYNKKKLLLLTRKSMLMQLQDQLLEQTNEIESFIAGITDSRMRRIINLRYVERLSWNDVAIKIGGGNTEDSIRMAFNRFIIE